MPPLVRALNRLSTPHMLCNTVYVQIMKTNITIRIDDKLAHEAKVLAARKGTSLSRLIAEELKSIAREWTARYLSWQVVAADGQAVLNAIELQSQYQVSFWAAMILQAALRAGASTLLSEDLNHGQQYGAVVVENPLR